MRELLFLSHRIPYPPDKGDKIRAWHIFSHLAQSHRIHLGCFIDDPADWRHVADLHPLCAELACFGLDRRWQRLRALARLRPGQPLTLRYFHDARLQRWVDGKLANVDRVFVFCSAMAPYIIDSERLSCILDMVDVDSEKWASYAQHAPWPMRLVWAREARTLLAFERQAALHFGRTLFVSEHERQHFATLAPESRHRTLSIENGVDLQRFSPQLDLPNPYSGAAPAIVFTGTMDYWPNADAVLWFAREAMPLLRRRSPAPEFHVVGVNPGPEVQALAALSDIRVIGRVPDIRPYVAHAAVVVAPLRIARGVQNKVLEALAMGKPVVASPQAHQGLRVRPGRDLLVADGTDAMVRLVAEVLDGRHPHVGPAGRRAVEQDYDWAVALRRLDSLLGENPSAMPLHPMAEPAGMTP